MKKILLVFLIILLGCSHSVTSSKFTNWKLAKHKGLPGIVAITTAWGQSHLCTGVLIKRNVVLTAAHCLWVPAGDLYIASGCNDVNHSCKITPVSKIYKHNQNYVSSDDLGLLITDQLIENISPAEIYTGEYIYNMPVVMAGFGRRGNDYGVLYSFVGRFKTNYTYEFTAGRQGLLDPNPGDSGGPAYAMDQSKLKVAGILSRSRLHTKKQGWEKTGYGIYTKPSPYRDWIKHVVKHSY